MDTKELEKAYEDADAAFAAADAALIEVRKTDPTLESLASVQVHERWKLARGAVEAALGALRDAELGAPVAEPAAE